MSALKCLEYKITIIYLEFQKCIESNKWLLKLSHRGYGNDSFLREKSQDNTTILHYMNDKYQEIIHEAAVNIKLKTRRPTTTPKYLEVILLPLWDGDVALHRVSLSRSLDCNKFSFKYDGRPLEVELNTTLNNKY